MPRLRVSRLRAIGVHEDGRDALRLVLAFETVDEIFRRKAVGGQGAIAEKVADGVVVLIVSEAAELDEWRLERGDRRGGGVGLRSQGGEMIHPSDELCFLRRAGFDALATGVGDAVCGLADQERLRGIGAVDENPEGIAESFNFGRRGVRVGKMQARSGGDAIRVVAHGTTRGFEHRVKGRAE